MNLQKTFILSLKTANELFTALAERIQKGRLPADVTGITDALDFYENFFEPYKEAPESLTKTDAMLCLSRIPILRADLAWRVNRSKAIFYSDL
jgi:hypothetical protein